MNEAGSPKERPKRGGDGVGTATNPTNPPDQYASGYDFLLINRNIEDPLFADVVSCVTKHRSNPKLVFILVTHGGQANVAYRVARFLQTAYHEDLVAFAPSLCKSAGTLLIAAGNRVVISPVGEIGPLDVQQIRRDEIWGQRSGLTTRSAITDLHYHTFDLFEHVMFQIIRRSQGAISFRLAAELAGRLSGDVMSRIYEQVTPEALGQDFRDLNVATKYCERLNKRSGNLKPAAIRRLVYEYPSHDFVIDFEEASEIFNRVELPTPTLMHVIQSRIADVMMPRNVRQPLVEMLQMPKPAIKKKASESLGTNAEKSGDDGDRKQAERTERDSGGTAPET